MWHKKWASIMLQSWDERRVSEKKPRLSWLPLGTKTLQANSRHDD